MPELALSDATYGATFASIREHFARGTLVQGLPRARCPFVFVHGRESPIPWRRSAESAELVPGARLEIVEGCGHFPWLERPGSIRGALERAGLP